MTKSVGGGGVGLFITIGCLINVPPKIRYNYFILQGHALIRGHDVPKNSTLQEARLLRGHDY